MGILKKKKPMKLKDINFSVDKCFNIDHGN